MVKTSKARGPSGLEKMSLGCNVKSASGWTVGGDRARSRVRSWHGNSTAARSPCLEKAAHVWKKWNALEASMATWWRAVPNATPPHFKKVTYHIIRKSPFKKSKTIFETNKSTQFIYFTL